MGLEQTGRIAAHRRSIRRIPTSCSPARSATPTGRSRSAASSARPTAARPGPRRCSSTRTPAAPTSRWIRRTRASSSPACGSSRSTPGAATSGGPGSGLFMSRDGGATWTRLTGHGLPTQAGRQGRRRDRAVEPEPRLRADRDRRRRAVEGPGDRARPAVALRRRRRHLAVVSYDRNAMGRAHYYSRMAVAPDNENEAYFLTASFAKSIDGGATIIDAAAAPKRRAAITTTSGSIRPTRNRHDRRARPGPVDHASTAARPGIRQRLPIAQIYHVTVDNEIPYNVYGNKQDEPSYRGPSNSRLQGGFGGEPRHPARDVALGRRRRERLGDARSDRPEHRLVHGFRLRHRRRHRRALRGEPPAVPQRRGVAGPVERPGRGRAVPLRLGRAAARSRRTITTRSTSAASTCTARPNGGQSWQVISPDLTLNDKTQAGAAPAASRPTTSASSTRASSSGSPSRRARRG